MTSASLRKACRARPQVEALEPRELMTASISGSVLQNFTSAPLSGRVVYVDLHDEGRLDADDPSTSTSVSGSYSLTLANVTAPSTLTVRFQTDPGDVSVPDLQSVTLSPGGNSTAAPLLLQSTSPIQPLAYTATPDAAGTSDATTAEVTRLYAEILGRAPDPGGLVNGVARLHAGMPLSELATIFYPGRLARLGRHPLEPTTWPCRPAGSRSRRMATRWPSRWMAEPRCTT